MNSDVRQRGSRSEGSDSRDKRSGGGTRRKEGTRGREVYSQHNNTLTATGERPCACTGMPLIAFSSGGAFTAREAGACWRPRLENRPSAWAPSTRGDGPPQHRSRSRVGLCRGKQGSTWPGEVRVEQRRLAPNAHTCTKKAQRCLRRRRATATPLPLQLLQQGIHAQAPPHPRPSRRRALYYMR